MRPLSVIGLVVLILGVLSFLIPIPMNKRHEVKAGGVLCAVGAVLLIVGSRKAIA